MTDPENPPRPTPQKPARKPDRAERLAEELRANLRRRKDQARGRAVAGDGEPTACGDGSADEPVDRSGG